MGQPETGTQDGICYSFLLWGTWTHAAQSTLYTTGVCMHSRQQVGPWQTISASGGQLVLLLQRVLQSIHLPSVSTWGYSCMQVNRAEFICKCARLQMSVSAVECEESYLWFSAYQDFYFLHIALCAAETEALWGHRDAQLFIIPFNKTWISTACASCRHSRKWVLQIFFPECFRTVGLNF